MRAPPSRLWQEERSEPLSPPQPGRASVEHTRELPTRCLDSSLLTWVTSALGFCAAHWGPRHPLAPWSQWNFLNGSYLGCLSYLNPAVVPQCLQEEDPGLSGVWGASAVQFRGPTDLSAPPFRPLPLYTSLSGQPEPFAVSCMLIG